MTKNLALIVLVSTVFSCKTSSSDRGSNTENPSTIATDTTESEDSSLYNCELSPSERTYSCPPDCRTPVKKIFAQIVGIQNGISVNSDKVSIGELDAYKWSVSVSTTKGGFEYLALVNNDANCNILSFIEAKNENPKADIHWEL